MCKAFSCIIDMTGHVYWKIGLDSHEDIIKNFKLDDKTTASKICRIEYAPANEDYVRPDTWVMLFDNAEKAIPVWWKKSHDNAVEHAFKEWKRKVYSLIDMDAVKKPINPFDVVPQKVSKKVLIKLLAWDSVWDSVGYSVWYSVWNSVWNSVGYSVGYSVEDSVGDSVRSSVWDSVGDSVGDSVWNSVWNSVWYSVWNSVWNSVWDSVWAYTGSMFRLPRKAWKYTEKIKTAKYPFQPAVDLWKLGFVPSFDGKIWRLHAGKETSIVWQGTREELEQRVKG